MRRPSSMSMELNIGDIETVLDVARSGSVSGTARSRGVTASQVSKAIARVEKHVGVALFARSARGLRLSDAGRGVTRRFVEIIAQVRELLATADEAELTVVASSFLTSFFLPCIAAALPSVRVHSLENPPGTASAFAGLPLFDIALTTGVERWPTSWASLPVGTIRRALFASPAAARSLGPRPTLDTLRGRTFIGPVYGEGGMVVPGDDRCPLSLRERRFGHRTQTVAVALELAARGDALIFAPVIAALGHVGRGELVEVPVERWNVREPLFLVCHQERVGAHAQRMVAAAVRNALRDAEPRAGR